VVDDHPIVLHGLTQLFERQADLLVVGSCSDSAQALDTVIAQKPDVLVLDLRMPGMTGLDLLRALALTTIETRPVLLTAAIKESEVVEAVKLGAKGLVLKESPPETLLDCVRRVARGDTWIDRETAFQTVVDGDRPAPGDSLTARELEIVRMVGQGFRNKA